MPEKKDSISIERCIQTVFMQEVYNNKSSQSSFLSFKALPDWSVL